jgi:1-acyl-sn-glycerol-3-phosphate acyltransferase
MKRRFSGIHVRPPRAQVFRDIPLVAVANHVSWWDGFLLLELHRLMRPGAQFYTVMLESELRQHPFLERIGAIGIDPQSPSAVVSCIRELKRRVESHPDAMIFFFPQGRILPSWRRPLGFRRGIEVFCEALKEVVVIPVALHIEPLNTVAPHAFVSAGEPVTGESISALALEQRVQCEIDNVMSTLACRVDDHMLQPLQLRFACRRAR